MSLPTGVVVVNAVGGGEVLFLERREKLFRYMLFWPESIEPNQGCDNENKNHDGDIARSSLALDFRVIRLGVQESHTSSSIMDAGGKSKVAGEIARTQILLECPLEERDCDAESYGGEDGEEQHVAPDSRQRGLFE